MRARVCQRCGKLVSGPCDCKPPQGSTSKKGYGRKWQRFRESVFKKRLREGKAFCAECGHAFGADSPHGDHITPVKGPDDPLFFVESNIQVLHAECHGRKTADDVRAGATRRGNPHRGLKTWGELFPSIR